MAWRSRGPGYARGLGRADAAQRDLIGALGAVHVRFLFGLPFAVLFFFGLLPATGDHAPPLGLAAFGWTAFGAFAQVVATARMLAAMRTRSFVVAVAYTKTEPSLREGLGMGLIVAAAWVLV
jgi:hypothetical protein